MQGSDVIEVDRMQVDWGNGAPAAADSAPITAVAAGERKTGQQRRYAPKTRTGCITCKIRRVKCDEQKPFCKRCTTTGRKCDGYAPLSPQHDGQPRSPEPLTVALVKNSSNDALERRTFDFFRARTAPCVSGYFQDAVWDRIVLQLSHSEPAVRYAVNALGALHEEKMLRKSAGKSGIDVSLVRTGFPTQQYAKALGEMQALMKSDSVSLDLILLCALLCVHFEALRESFVSALMHIESAISLLHNNTTFDARKVNPALVRAIMRLDLQGTMYLGMRIPGLPYYTATADSVLPSTFHDLTQARDLINTWTSRLFHYMRTVTDEYKFHNPGNVPLEVFAKTQEFEEIFLALDQLLWDYMHKPTVKLAIREQHGLNVLRGRAKMNRILAATCVYSEATLFDRYLDEFKEILTICQYIIGSDNADRRLFSVSLDEGLIHPLFFIATHCRDSPTRHQALDLLKKLPAQDGIWHVETSVRTAELCVKFEEEGCSKEVPACEDIPEWKRIHCAHFDRLDLDYPNRSVRVILRTRPNGMDGAWTDVEEMMEWSVRYPAQLILSMDWTNFDDSSKGSDPLDDLKTIYEVKEPALSHMHRFKLPRTMTWG